MGVVIYVVVVDVGKGSFEKTVQNVSKSDLTQIDLAFGSCRAWYTYKLLMDFFSPYARRTQHVYFACDNDQSRWATSIEVSGGEIEADGNAKLIKYQTLRASAWSI